jgi:hypothetical protein
MPGNSDKEKAKFRKSVLKGFGVFLVLCMFGYESWPSFTKMCGAAFFFTVGSVVMFQVIANARPGSEDTSVNSGGE